MPSNPPAPNNSQFKAMVASRQESEYKNEPHLPISSVGTDYKTADETNLPAGSALLTDTLDGSGNGTSKLYQKGITHIIHAAPKPRSSFFSDQADQDYINNVVKSVQNSIILADRNNFEKLVIPFVGGGIYLGSCDPAKLAQGIMCGALNQLAGCQIIQQIIFLDWHDDRTPRKNRQVFLTAFGKFEDEGGWFGKHVGGNTVELAKNSTKTVIFEWGDIRDKSIHEANVIVNAANTYVGFGGGISGAIAQEVGDRTKIEAEAKKLIRKFKQLII